MAEHPEGVAGVFDRAATYDAVGVGWFRPIARAVVDRLAPQAGERALDIGCGRGAALLPPSGRGRTGSAPCGRPFPPTVTRPCARRRTR